MSFPDDNDQLLTNEYESPTYSSMDNFEEEKNSLVLHDESKINNSKDKSRERSLCESKSQTLLRDYFIPTIEIKKEEDQKQVNSISEDYHSDETDDGNTSHSQVKDEDIKDEAGVKVEEDWEDKIEDGNNDLGNVFQCSFCQKEFQIAWKARYHERLSHLGISKSRCEFCDSEFKQRSDLQDHQLRMHCEPLELKLGTPIPRHKCETCFKSFSIQRDLNTHSRKAHGPKQPKNRKYICDLCGKRFECPAHLRRHEYSIHNIESEANGQFPCPDCCKVYPFQVKLNKHMKRIHQAVSVSCEECGKRFNSTDNLKRHKWQHGDPQFKCDICQIFFREPRQSKEHHRIVHENKLLVCEPCGEEFTYTTTFRDHKYRCHNKDKLDEVLSCENCGKQFATKNLLRRHEKRHIENFTCDACGSSYKSNASLKCHIETIHKGERNFACDECGKSFTRQNVLKTHKMLHTSLSKPFYCIYCNSIYGEKRNLLNHIARSHPDEPVSFKKLSEDDGFETFSV